MSRHSHDPERDPEPINNSIVEGLYRGFRRPRFRHDAPRWFTILVFGFFVALILALLFVPNR